MTELVTSDEARRLLFSKEGRPSPRTFAAWTDRYDLPAVTFGKTTYFFKDQLQARLDELQRRPRHEA